MIALSKLTKNPNRPSEPFKFIEVGDSYVHDATMYNNTNSEHDIRRLDSWRARAGAMFLLAIYSIAECIPKTPYKILVVGDRYLYDGDIYENMNFTDDLQRLKTWKCHC